MPKVSNIEMNNIAPTQELKPSPQQKNEVVSKPETKPDTFEKSQSDAKQPKKSGFSKFCKAFVSTGELVKATLNTAIFGGLGAGAIMFSDWLFKGWPKVMKKELAFADMFKKPLSCVSKSSKIIAGTAFGLIGAFQFAKVIVDKDKLKKQI